METEKLYYQDPYLTAFTARVLSCEKSKSGWAVVLDRTAFYPEGGGQPADHGTLGAVQVTDVHETKGVIFHTCDGPVEIGTQVAGAVDWPRRFDHMQQHSGEHILSGLLCSLYHCDNVGFHLGADTVTIDYNAELTWEQVMAAEKAANEVIWQDTPVDITFYRYLSQVYDQDRAVAQLLSVKPQDTLAAAERQAEELAAAKQRMTELEDQLFSLRAQALTDRGDLLLLEPPTRPDGARKLADAAAKASGGLAAVFAGAESSYVYALVQADGADISPLVKRLNAALSGRGGGRNGFAQGSVQADRTAIYDFFRKEGIEWPTCGSNRILRKRTSPGSSTRNWTAGAGRSGGWTSTPMASALPTAATTAGRRLSPLPPTRRTCGR